MFTTVQDYVRDVTVGPDGLVYAAVGGKQNSAYAFDPTTGKQKWRQHANGDVQAVKYSNGYVLRLPRRLHDQRRAQLHAADPGRRPADRRPQPGLHARVRRLPGVLTIDADGTYLAVGGYFGRMGGTSVNGLSIHPSSRASRSVGRAVLRPVPVAMMTAAALAATAIACTPPSS